jgi:Tfp pilus assembly protein PilF
VQADPTSADAHAQLAEAFAQQGRNAQAALERRKAAQLSHSTVGTMGGPLP